VSVARLLDDLARTLAEPMSRRRALRVLGTTVAAAAVPGLRPSVAGATRRAIGYTCNPNVETCCDKDERVCHKDAPVPQNKGYCCPAPSWQWWCGDKKNGYKCVDRCGADHLFPCTGRFADKSSGVNGLCCDDRIHAACDPDAYRLSGGGSSPLCLPPTCGPDVSRALSAAITRTRLEFATWGDAKRVLQCDSLLTPGIGQIGWEINELGPGGRDQLAESAKPKCATCTKNPSVQVDGCHYAGSVNYVIFGVMMRLCHTDYRDSVGPARLRASYYEESSMVTIISAYKTLRRAPNKAASIRWAKAGYNGWPSVPAPQPELLKCAACPNEVRRLTVRWLPLKRQI
jgi:hypothetical protein